MSRHDLQRDIEYCLEPIDGLAVEDVDRLRTVIGRVITNPSAHRSELLALVIELAGPPAG